MKQLRLLVVLVLSSLLACCASVATAARHDHYEAYYQAIWCNQQNGTTEYVLFDRTRVDCLTQSHAIEVDFAEKAWKEGVGQAYWYSLVTRRQPGVLVILEREDDCRYMARLRDMTHFLHPKITVWQTGAWAYQCDEDR